MQKNSSIRLQEELPENWERIEGLLVMHFGQIWSGASLFTQGIVAEVVRQYPEKLCAFEVNEESTESFKERFRVSQIPTVLIFQQGLIVASFVGLFPRHKLLEAVENLLHHPSDSTSDSKIEK